MKRNYEEPEMEVLYIEFADVMNQLLLQLRKAELGSWILAILTKA